MNARVVVAGVLAGIVVFVWSFVSHMALPVGEMGIAMMPDQEAVLPMLSEHLNENKVYGFPWYEDQEKMNAAYATSPHGILVFSPPEGPFSFARALAVEAGSNVLAGLLAAFLFAASGAASAAASGWGRRLAFGAALGTFASVAIDVPYWNWYGFPGEYLAGQLLDSVVGWSLAALVIGWWFGRKPRPAGATPA